MNDTFLWGLGQLKHMTRICLEAQHRFRGIFWLPYINCWGRFHRGERERPHCRRAQQGRNWLIWPAASLPIIWIMTSWSHTHPHPSSLTVCLSLALRIKESTGVKWQLQALRGRRRKNAEIKDKVSSFVDPNTWVLFCNLLKLSARNKLYQIYLSSVNTEP